MILAANIIQQIPVAWYMIPIFRHTGIISLSADFEVADRFEYSLDQRLIIYNYLSLSYY